MVSPAILLDKAESSRPQAGGIAKAEENNQTGVLK